jgi:hypothetical protein
MARDIKWALHEAEEAGYISRITVDDKDKKKLFNSSRKGALALLIGSVVVLAIAIGIVALLVAFVHIIVYSIKMIILYIFLLILPFYSVYNIFAVSKAIRKGDCDFYVGEILTKTDKGYKVKGLEDQDLSFIGGTKSELAPGSRVKIYRLNDSVDLFDL